MKIDWNSWNLEGHEIEGLYISEYPVTGRVTLSRVAYGGNIEHHIVLSKSLIVESDSRVIIERLAGEGIIVEHKDVTQVREIPVVSITSED